MKRQLVYDVPTRFFHWAFAGLFLFAFVVAKTVDDDSPLFSYHSLAGLTLGFLIILRIVWGFWGTKHARFSGFALNPKDLVSYFGDILSGQKRLWAGHNPASSWAAISMFVMGLGLAITGYLMTSGAGAEAYEDIHEVLANGFIVVTVLHIAGIILHTLRYRQSIALSMVDGKKQDVPVVDVIPSAKMGLGILLIALTVGFGVNLYKNYDSQTRSLQFFGTVLQLGENEGNENDGGDGDVGGESNEVEGDSDQDDD